MESVIYEVNLDVEPEISDEFLRWLRGHALELVALPGFLGVTCHQRTDSPDVQQWVCRYELESQAALDRYFEEFAPKAREDGIRKFGDKFSASRRVMKKTFEF